MKNDTKSKNLEIAKLKEDSKNKDKKITELSNQMNKIQKELDKLLREKKEKEIEEIIRKEKFDKYIDLIFTENETQIKESKYNFIIGEYYHNSFKTLNQLIISKVKFNFFIDFKTFVRLTYSKENLSMINDIENKHFNELKKLVKLNINKPILLVDFVFILNLRKIMSLYFKSIDLIIKCANNGLYVLFLLYFNHRPNSENECSFLLEENILSYERINLNKISNLYNFINYYYEINDSMNENNLLEYFPIYDPVNEINQYFLTIKTTDYTKEDILVLFCSSFLDFEDLSLDDYNNYKYILILFQSYDFNYDKNIGDYISRFYFKKEPDFIQKIPDNLNTISESESYCLISFGKSSNNNIAILDKQKSRIQFKFIGKKISNSKYVIATDNIIDKKIQIIIVEIAFKNTKVTDILIEEPFNIIYSYINNKYNKSNIVLLNGNKNNDNDIIKNIITTIETKEIKEYLLEFLNKKSELKFDLIISSNNLYLENENNVKHKFLDKDKLSNIKYHLKENGVFCFYLFLKNKYFEEKIREKLELVFDKDNITIYNHKLDYIIICRNN